MYIIHKCCDCFSFHNCFDNGLVIQVGLLKGWESSGLEKKRALPNSDFRL